MREGLPADRIIKVGSPMYEVLHQYMPAIKVSNILKNMQLEEGKYFVVSTHREENVNNDRLFHQWVDVLNTIADRYHFPVIVSCHPRTRKMIESKGIVFRKEIQLLKPLGFIDYNHLQLHATAVLSDSGTISEESSILNFRALNIREAHERPEAMEEAAVIMAGMNPERIMQGLAELQHQKVEERNFPLVSDYSKPNVSDKVVRIILSYTDYVKRVVWGV